MYKITCQSSFRVANQMIRQCLGKFNPSAAGCLSALLNKNGCSLYSTSREEDYLHRSVLPTDFFQKSLPRLPIPKLEDTCRRYLKAQVPLLTPDQYKYTESVVNAFRDGEGKALHEELKAIDKRNKHTSYISGPWFDMYLMAREPLVLNYNGFLGCNDDSKPDYNHQARPWFDMYLKDRAPLVLNYNPFMGINDDPKPGYNDQLIRATNYVHSSMKFMKTLYANILEPEVFHLNPAKSDTAGFRRFVKLLPSSIATYGAYLYKAFPLDISQYGRLFNSTRIPRKERDELFTDTSGKHVLVMRKGNFYIFDTLDKDGNIIPPTEIMAHLKYILADATPAPEFPIGLLTSDNRDIWANQRDALLAAGNTEQLRLIDSATFVLALDDTETSEPLDICRLFLHSDGVNRWFDKSFTLIMTKKGHTAVNMEHAWGDGVAVLRYFNDTFKDTTKTPILHPGTQPANVDSSSAVRRLEFQLTDQIKQGVRDAKERFDKLIGGFDLQYTQYEKFGKNYIKKKKLSPDSVLQLMIQMAFYKQYGTTVGTYESCSTAAFKHGRTETMRPATIATKKMCEMIEKSGADINVAKLQAGLQECSTVHQQLTKEAAMGQGFDRHMFGLRSLAEASGKVSDIFTDPAYIQINHHTLSTSTLTSPALMIGGFGAVVPDGYGVGYGVKDEQLGSTVTCYPPARNTKDYLECFRQSADDIYEILEGRKPRN